MDKRNDDPGYQLHELKRPDRERGGPRTDATGQEDREERDESSFQSVNQRINESRRATSAVRDRAEKRAAPRTPPERADGG